MKVIDLLNMISKGEEVPKKIRYEGRDMFWCEPCKIYEVDVEQNELCGTDLYSILDNLNDEVEIIEEDKKIEHIGANNYEWNYKYPKNTPQAVVDNLELVRQKINEIIDKINSMEGK